MSAPRARARDAGYVLVTVLGSMLLLTAVLVAASGSLRSALGSVRLDDDDVALRALARSGLEVTAFQLFVSKSPAASVDGRRIRFADGVLTPTILDESGKIDLNSADAQILAGLFRAVGVDDAGARDAVAAILERRGTPPSAPAQAAATPAPPNRGFLAVDEIDGLPGLTRADVRALAPLLTVYNPDGRIDLLTAPATVLSALPGLTPPRIAEIVQTRARETDPAKLRTLLGLLGPSASFAKLEGGPVYTVRLAVAAADRRLQVAAVVAGSTSPNAPFYVMEWRD